MRCTEFYGCGKATCSTCGVVTHAQMPTVEKDCLCTWEVAGFLVVQNRHPQCQDHGTCLCVEYYGSPDREYIGTVYSKMCPRRECIPKALAQTDERRTEILRSFRDY